ncbi:MAG: right-handed parallel beta-helix repeat-containing protein [Sedimentisphaerales bacterium]
MLSRKMILGAALLLCVAFVVPSLATTYYVKPDGNDYSVLNVTQNKFYTTIQNGINSSSNGDEIIAYPRTYYESIDFNGLAITLRSSDPNNWDTVAATIIDGNGAADGVIFHHGETCSTVLTGITIEGSGNGILCNDTSPTISKCIIRNNTIRGIWGYGAPIITNNKIYNNGSYNIYLRSIAAPVVKNNEIYDANYGIRLISPWGTATISNNTIVHHAKGGIFKSGSSSTPIITNCIIWDCNDDLFGCSATYSCIQDGDAGTGNISSYPYFANYDGNDFHLTWNSPCINKGDPNGTYTGQTDIDGEERVIDSRVDIGADEKNNSANLVQNPGFELGGGGWNRYGQVDQSVPRDWNDMRPSISKSIDPCAHSGSYSWKFTNDGSKYSGAYSDFIKIDNENAYEFSVWVRAEGSAPVLYIGVEEFDKDQNSLGYTCWVADGIKGPMGWTQFSSKHRIYKKGVEYAKVRFAGPYLTSGTVWWDDFSFENLGPIYLPAYGCVNEPNIAESVKFGSNGLNENWVKGTITAYMSDPCTDSNDKNITYRELKAGKTIEIEFPAFDDGPNGLPNSPMLLEIMFKDTVGDEYNNTNVSYDRIKVSSKIDWIYQDPCYLASDTNRYCPLNSFGGFADGQWKYVQYDFQKSDFQELRAVNGKYTIKIENLTNSYGASYNVPIDYVCLRKISDSEWQSLYERQRDLRFKKVELADKCNICNYADPNLVIFCRDFMHPVYKDTRPAENEPNRIETFSAWSEVEPVSFSIYSEGGVDDLTISVSNLTNVNNSNSVIDGNDISIWKIVYDEARLGYAISQGSSVYMDYALVPDRLKKLSGTLSVDAGTSESVWLKINVPAKSANLSGGDYKGQIRIQKAGVYDKTIDVTLTVYDITLETPAYLSYVYHDPYRYSTNGYVTYSEDISKTFDAYTETKFDPIFTSGQYTIRVYQDTNQLYNVGFDTNVFEMGLDRAINEGFAKHKVNLLYDLSWSAIYSYSTRKPYGGINIWSQMSEPNFCYAFGRLINKYGEIGQSKSRDIEFIFHVTDEPGNDPYRRILCDRLYTIMKDTNYVDANYKIATGVTYYSSCDLPALPGDYNVPTADHNIPPLTNLVDYKIWALSNEPTGYGKRQDSNYHGYMGYYTTGYSHYRNPVYNRFLHGLFAYTTDACSVACYAMGDYIGDPYNDFDSSWVEIWPFTYPDFLLAYPTWSGEINHTIGGLEAIREGIKDGRYFATLKKLIAENPNNAVARTAQEYLDALKNRINPHYNVYESQQTEIGHYQAILKEISETNDANDYEVFTEIRKQLAEYIGLLIDGNDYSVLNVTQNKFYTTIQNGINSSSNGDEIIAYPRTYYESIDFNGLAITLRSSDPNNWDTVAATIIDGNGAADGVIFHHGETCSTVLTGITIEGSGNGILCNDTSPTISKCIIRNNTIRGIWGYGAPIITNNKIYNNGSYNIYLRSIAAPVVKNNEIYDANYGIRLISPWGTATISNNTIVHHAKGGIFKSGSSSTPIITNCIIWDCNDDLFGCSATYSCIENGDAGTGNISSDPCFIGAGNNDFHIGIHSPCVNAGDPNGSYIGETDIDGEARVIGRCVDIGADEVNFNALEPNGHWWKLDETSGTTAYDSVGTTNGTPCWVTGLIGGEVDLNGVSDYFSVSSLDNSYYATSTFTVAGWFKTSQSTGIQTIVGNWSQWYYSPGPNMTFYSGWQVLVENNKVVARFATNCPGIGLSNITGTKDVNDGWHHFALVHPNYPGQGTSNTILYVDGQSEGTPAFRYYCNTNTKFRIGDGSYVSSGNPPLKGGPFCGTIDDVMIFNRVLTANEVYQLYASGR